MVFFIVSKIFQQIIRLYTNSAFFQAASLTNVFLFKYFPDACVANALVITGKYSRFMILLNCCKGVLHLQHPDRTATLLLYFVLRTGCIFGKGTRKYL